MVSCLIHCACLLLALRLGSTTTNAPKTLKAPHEVLFDSLHVITCTETPSFVARFHYPKVNYKTNKKGLFFSPKRRLLIGFFCTLRPWVWNCYKIAKHPGFTKKNYLSGDGETCYQMMQKKVTLKWVSDQALGGFSVSWNVPRWMVGAWTEHYFSSFCLFPS
jgi:hypothetical protein